jgi:sugar/nucleoside kinase (ribokinase family)
MERKLTDTLSALREAKGIAYYGEILLEVDADPGQADARSLREEALQKADRLRPTADVLNVMGNIDALQRALGDKLCAAIPQVFTGPIGAKDELAVVLLSKLPFAVPPHCLVQTGEVGLCRLGVAEGGDMLITLDSERAAIRDAIRDVLYSDAVVREAKANGVFFSSLIGLGMSRNSGDFTAMLDVIHRSGVITVFDTNYRSYVMEHCYPQHNALSAAEMMAEIMPRIDVLLAGTEDVFALEPTKDRSIERTQREFFRQTRASALCILKAGKDGSYWRDKDGAWHHQPAVPVNVCSTTGAGDAFNAGLLLALKQGKTPEEAVKFAGVAAAEIVASEETVLSESASGRLASVFPR